MYGWPPGAAGKLMKIAAGLGSDVPFFMLDSVLAEGRGRGEKLKAFTPGGRLPYLVLVYPGVPVYTKEVYGNLKLGKAADIKRRLGDLAALRRLVKTGAFNKERAGLLFNRLEDPVLPRHPEVRLARERLAALGADAVLMSGSGATVFGLCWSAARAKAVAAGARRVRSYTCILTKFC